jgi:hypothetical protein
VATVANGSCRAVHRAHVELPEQTLVLLLGSCQINHCSYVSLVDRRKHVEVNLLACRLHFCSEVRYVVLWLLQQVGGW